MFEKWLSYRLIDELERDYRYARARTTDRDKRSRIAIAVVDDEPFTAEHNLRNAGYNITYLGDIRSLAEVEKFPIILCDLQGVGKHIDSKLQGAFIIDELKRNHPEKFVIAYTGGASDSQITMQAQQFADYFMRKDADMDEWRDKLDQIISVLSNPIDVWRRQRQALVDYDVSTLDIIKLEDAYVRAVLSKDDIIYRRLATTSNINPDVRAIIQSLVASGIFEVIKGS